MATRPEILMTGPYPSWDMEDLDARYVLHKLWEAADRDQMIAKNQDTIRAIACPYRKSNPLGVDRESGDAAARCLICANLSLEQ
jgi:ABC-type microcin C transport system permease subunit YejE